MNKYLYSVRYILILIYAIAFSSCNSLPPGNPPPEGEPIIKDPLPVQKVKHSPSAKIEKKISSKDNAEKKKKIFKKVKVDEESKILAKTADKGHIVEPSVPDGADAVNYMMIMIATKCSPIASPTNGVPRVLNEFTVANDKVNDFPLQVWNRLIKDSMIEPVSTPDDEYSYILSSSIEKLSENSDAKGIERYNWRMNMLEGHNRREIWHTSFEFSQ